MKKTNWLFSQKTDLWVLFAPVWLTWIVSFLLPETVVHAEVSIWVFVLIIIGLDVSHVWSTIFRTYLDKEEFNNHRSLLIVAPITAFIFSLALASISFHLFWRVLAYVAVFHFIKQQYGFMRIYKARNGDFRKKRISDSQVIYLSMIFPIFYWHINLNREFSWFVSGDFLQVNLPTQTVHLFNTIGIVAYFLILGFWLIEEFIYSRKPENQLPVGKVLWILTTAGNWYIGIVFFNSDLIFTITNVVAHGLPYIALIVFYEHRKSTFTHKKWSKSLIKAAFTIVLVIVILAFTEEYLWDVMVYRDHPQFFESVIDYPFELPSAFWQTVGLAMLSVPQITHYIVDRYIWKSNEKNPYLKEILLQ